MEKIKDNPELSIHRLAELLHLDRRGVARQCRRGMPRTSLAAAIDWRQRNLRVRRPRLKAHEAATIGYTSETIEEADQCHQPGDTDPTATSGAGTLDGNSRISNGIVEEGEPEGVYGEPGGPLVVAHGSNGSSIMAASIERLQEVETATCAALGRALRDPRRVAESSILRRDYTNAVKALHIGLSQMLRFDVERGKVIRLAKALEMIDAALHEPLMLIRGLPDLGCTPACKAKLESFAQALREAVRSGAAEGLRASGTDGA